MSSDIEYATRKRGLGTFKGLAESRKVDLELVLRAAAEDRLAAIVEMRDHSTYPDGRHVKGDPIEAMLALRAKIALADLAIQRALAH